MCGIAGILRIHEAGSPAPPPETAIPEPWLDVLDDSIRHRGPDGAGRFRDRVVRADGATVDVALVHRRLAIIDPAGGRQPMVVGHGGDRRAVVFNGCIYNHRKLRDELKGLGHEFATDHSDTEVIPHAWRAWGFGVLDRLEGMYAAAVWDVSLGDVVLLRDRFGEKPLYHFTERIEGGFVASWSSSFAGLVRLERLMGLREADAEGVWERLQGWIQFGWAVHVPHPRISELLPGSGRLLLGVKTKAGQGEARASGAPWGDALNPSRADLDAGTIDELLRSAVQSRLEADAPLGVFLSGGVDSALIAKYAAELRPDIAAFTVRMPAGEYDESAAAAVTARALGVRHEVLDCAPTPAEDLVSLIEQLGLPFGDSSLLPATWVSRAARQRVKVALGGEGGDELFLGYERHAAARWLWRASRLPRDVLLHLASMAESGASPKSRRSKSARFFHAAAANGYQDLLAIFPPYLAEELWPGARIRDATPSIDHGAAVSRPGGSGDRDFSLSLCRRLDLLLYLPCDLLRKSDTASMSVALEVRAPMLDSALASRAIHASWRSLMPRGQRKGLLRQVARQYLPSEIVDRPKMGFAIPISEWFRSDYGGLRTLLMDRLRSAEAFGPPSLGIELNRAFIDRMVREHMEGTRDHGQRLYMLLVLSVWADWMGRVRRGSV